MEKGLSRLEKKARTSEKPAAKKSVGTASAEAPAPKLRQKVLHAPFYAGSPEKRRGATGAGEATSSQNATGSTESAGMPVDGLELAVLEVVDASGEPQSQHENDAR